MYLGLDLGTSGLRGILVDGAGKVVAEAEAGVATSNPNPGWSEQDPQDWIDACRTVMGRLRDADGRSWSAVRAIGLSGHMHGATHPSTATRYAC